MMHVCMHACMHVCVCMYNLYMYVCMYDVCVYMCVCVPCVFVHVCVWVYMSASVSMCVHVRVCHPAAKAWPS